MERPPRASSSVAATLSLASAVAAVVALVVPWWDELGPLELAQHLPKVFVAGTVLVFALGVSDLFGRVTDRMGQGIAGLALMFMVVALVGFYIRVDDKALGGQLPFTHHVEPGFFVAGLALVLLVPRLFVSGGMLALDQRAVTRSRSNAATLVGVLGFIVLATTAAGMFIATWEPDRPGVSERVRREMEDLAIDDFHPPEERLLTGRYPSACLRRVAPPEDAGLIAVSFNGTVTIGSPYEPVGRVRESGPVMWSPSGKYFAVNHGAVYDVAPTLILQDTRLEMWGWSPVADCLVGVTKDGSLEVRIPNGDGRVLISRKDEGASVAVKRFRFSANGRFLDVRFQKGRRAVLDLRKNESAPSAAISGNDFDVPEVCAEIPGLASVSCSQNEEFVVGVRDAYLVLARPDGSEQRRLTFGDYTDRSPEWGPPRTGVLFLRRPGESDRTEVWFIPEGGSAVRTPLTLPSAEGFGYGTFPWADVIDWNVSPTSIVRSAR